MKEIIQTRKLNNGLSVILSPIASTKAVTVLVLFGTGSRYEPEKIGGISHFLEHMYFKGTKRRPTALAVSEELDSMGSSFNAFTSKEYTGYYIKAASHHLDQMLDILSDMLFEPLFDAKEMEKEKGAVIQEINMYEDSPREYVDDLYEENLYGKDHPLGRMIAGTREKVRGITREQLLQYLKDHYFGENAIVSIAGEIDPADALKKVTKYFGRMPKGKKQIPAKFKKSATEPKIYYKKTEQTHLIIGSLGYPYSYKHKNAYKLLGIALGGSMSSRLFIKIRERRGLAYFVRTGTSEYMDTGTIATQAGIDNDKVYEAIQAIAEEYKLVAKDLNAKELIKAKEIAKGRMILDYEDSMSVAMRLGMDARYGEKLRTLNERIKDIDKVTLAEVKAVAKDVFKPPYSLALIGPFKDPKKFSKLIK